MVADKLKIAITGCSGRMGQLMVKEVLASSNSMLIGGSVRASSLHVGKDIGELAGCGATGILASADPLSLFKDADCIVDFSHVSALTNHLHLATTYKKPLVIAVTGISEQDRLSMRKTGKSIPLLYAANMSLGITLLQTLAEQAAKLLPLEFDIDVVESHHRHKKDAPSGTSLALGKAVKKGREKIQPLQDYYYPLPASHERPVNTLGYSVLRSGGIPGDHSVIFASDGEIIEFKHRSLTRQIYAAGALKAAHWLVQQPIGFYNMQDVLN